MKVTKDQLYQVYLRARKGKSKKKTIIKRDQEFKENMNNLYQELVSGNYEITRPTRHIIQESVARELLVLHFRDRIVQHLVYEVISNAGATILSGFHIASKKENVLCPCRGVNVMFL